MSARGSVPGFWSALPVRFVISGGPIRGYVRVQLRLAGGTARSASLVHCEARSSRKAVSTAPQELVCEARAAKRGWSNAHHESVGVL